MKQRNKRTTRGSARLETSWHHHSARSKRFNTSTSSSEFSHQKTASSRREIFIRGFTSFSMGTVHSLIEWRRRPSGSQASTSSSMPIWSASLWMQTRNQISIWKTLTIWSSLRRLSTQNSTIHLRSIQRVCRRVKVNNSNFLSSNLLILIKCLTSGLKKSSSRWRGLCSLID